MSRKNPDNKPLRIVRDRTLPDDRWYMESLNALLVSQSHLVRAGKDSAMPHFIAIVKEIERIHNFQFEQIDDTQEI